MNSAEKEFDSLLTDMEREITALKTAHQRPLGVLNFFRKTEIFTINLAHDYSSFYSATIKLVIRVEPSDKPPIFQIGYNIPRGVRQIYTNEAKTNSDYSVWEFELYILAQNTTSTQFTAGAVCSQPIHSIEWSVL